MNKIRRDCFLRLVFCFQRHKLAVHPQCRWRLKEVMRGCMYKFSWYRQSIMPSHQMIIILLVSENYIFLFSGAQLACPFNSSKITSWYCIPSLNNSTNISYMRDQGKLLWFISVKSGWWEDGKGRRHLFWVPIINL